MIILSCHIIDFEIFFQPNLEENCIHKIISHLTCIVQTISLLSHNQPDTLTFILWFDK